ncbi:Leucine-rich repeat receptor protein kinase MSP1 [Vitis vinifera]|uniref:Leucine-rich repeat receptor protein kinase MSP1 n=1 Tax=Vitis vinifera TaxID=29760 RepID=A0A438BND7_VITVI|nr:Leucine-rich repeat receptor protein kinase MSP1 [Vitis vinifera]
MELTDWTYTNGSGQIDELVFNGKFPKKSHLTYLNIAQNSFEGELPASFGGLTHLIYILAANAGLSGRILGELKICNAKSLIILVPSDNYFTAGYSGTVKKLFSAKIPDQLWESKTLMGILFSNNLLTGPAVPKFFALRNLQGLVLLHNHVTGTIPVDLGLFTGYAPEICMKNQQCSALLPLSLLGRATHLQGMLRQKTVVVDKGKGKLVAVMKPLDILSVTENFSKTNIIGDVGKLKHENLVPLLGYCIFEDEKFLVYECMENGSLDVWLRNRTDAVEAMDWPTRFKIGLGSARGRFSASWHYFGLARIISACESYGSTVLAGTLDVYLQNTGILWWLLATSKGDVCNFGVVILELVTGRAPTGQADVEGGNLVGWVGWMVANGREDDEQYPYFSTITMWKDEMLCAFNCMIAHI